jgi:hypothetical protein
LAAHEIEDGSPLLCVFRVERIHDSLGWEGFPVLSSFFFRSLMTHEAFVFPAHPVAAPTSGLCHAAIPSISAAGRATSTSP